jgi:V-type H+-transporting ATPase subunit a
MIVPHRYLFALMGFFSTYCGFIYNDFLSMNLNLFGSCYNVENAMPHQTIPRDDGCIYPFGVDPVWGVAENNLNYINSLKMKISVVIGVIHMTVGVIIKATNSLYFRRKV